MGTCKPETLKAKYKSKYLQSQGQFQAQVLNVQGQAQVLRFWCLSTVQVQAQGQALTRLEKLYYKEMFDAKSNSVKQLWHNLNEIASFKERTSCFSNISQLTNSKNEIFTDSKVISNELNQYFFTIGAKLVEYLMRNNTLSNSHRVTVRVWLRAAYFVILCIS
jgi:hypothetical protein